MADVIVKDSKINGKGVFAARDFKKGEVVLKWDVSHRLSKEQVKQVPESERKYLIILKDGSYCLLKSPQRYVNHSCQPNTRSFDGKYNGAIRDINKGEEISGSYTWKGGTHDAFTCNCGSKNCIGKIDGNFK